MSQPPHTRTQNAPSVPNRPDQKPAEVESIYVHAPFCARRCYYCDFAVTVNRHGGSLEWIEAISLELAHLAGVGDIQLPTQLDTLYVGGGTPSLLGEEAMQGLIDVLRDRSVDLADGVEWTAEANPESLTRDLAEAWRAAGVNRLSIGVQSFQDSALRWMGRLHGSSGAADAVSTARQAGIENLSIDLIFGLPDDLDRSWPQDLDEALALEPNHLSLYGLTAEPSTPLGRAVGAGKTQLCDESHYREQYLFACDRLSSAGYHHYEVSNFCLPGRESRHNRAYWSGRPYLGLGNSAHSFLPPVRRWNQRDWPDYVERLQAGRGAVEDGEVVSGDSSRLERLWLELRTGEGTRYADLGPGAEDIVFRWRSEGLADLNGEAVKLTPTGWLVMDAMLLELDAVLGVA